MTPADLTAAHDGKRIRVLTAPGWPGELVGTYRHRQHPAGHGDPDLWEFGYIECPPTQPGRDHDNWLLFRDDRIELLDQEDQ